MLAGVVRYSADKSCAVAHSTVVPHRGGPRMSLSKRRSSSVGNKARLAASHQSVPGPVSSSTLASSSLAVNSTLNTASLLQHADKVFSAVNPCFPVLITLLWFFLYLMSHFGMAFGL